MHSNLSLRAALVAVCAVTPNALAQQFQQVTAFPGTARWSEGVEAADVDRDGDLDLFVADGDGFVNPGTQRQNLLWINKHVEGQTWTIVDESVARLGVHVSHAKGVATADIDADGWVDALYSNAFGSQLPFLYVNQGAANPGFFDFEGVARGFTTIVSAGSAGFGDLDDDGDLDVIINDAYNVASAKKARLYFNDGNGFFTENAAALNAPNKSGQMDVQLVDIDNDWDLDFLGANKSTAPNAAHYLMLNSGIGTFSDSSALLSSASGSTYEIEVGDLDGDQDLDLMYLSFSGFTEAFARNGLVPSGTLGFTNSATFGAQDDNEIALFDYDVDGDYDALVGSLGAREKLYRNDGNMVFVDQSTAIVAQADSTLDLAVVDLNNDGAYDIVTVQGESNNFTNKFYRNTGVADTRAPDVVAELEPQSPSAVGPWIAKARVRDQVLDDGVNYVTGRVDYVVLTSPVTQAVSLGVGGPTPASFSLGTGGTVTWTNTSASALTIALVGSPHAFDSGPIAPNGTYTRSFLAPGTYTYGIVGGASGSFTIVGSPSTQIALHQGGQIYRARMDDTASGGGVSLVYQLVFTDWPGNQRVTTARVVTLPGGPTGSAYCSGDGSATACPCGNAGAVGHGCASSVNAAGARLQAIGGASLTLDTLVLAGNAMPNNSVLYFQGTARTNSGLGNPFGDGLRCVGGSVIRLATKTNVLGASSFPASGDPSVSVKGAIGVPGQRHYQAWYRNTAAFCTSDTFNLSNGWTITWTP